MKSLLLFCKKLKGHVDNDLSIESVMNLANLRSLTNQRNLKHQSTHSFLQFQLLTYMTGNED